MSKKKYLFILECFPEANNEDWVQKNYYILREFIKRKKNISIIILDKQVSINTKLKSKEKFLKEFSKFARISISKIEKNLNFLQKIKRFISPFPKHHFKITQNIIDKAKNFTNNNEPEIIVSVGHSANYLVKSLGFSNSKKIFIIGGIPYLFVTSTIKELIKYEPHNFYKAIVIYLFLIKEMIFIRYLSSLCDLIITFDYNIVSYFNNKTIAYTNAVQDWLPKKFGNKLLSFKRKKNILLLISGNTTPNRNATENFIKFIIPHLKEKYKDSDKLGQIRVIGSKSSLIKKIQNLKYDKIKCVGWVKDISKEFCKNTLLIVPNSNKMYQSTRIVHAFTCGLPVLTHKSNTIFDKFLIKNKNLLVAENFKEFNEMIDKVLNNKISLKKISLNARKTYVKYYRIDNVVKRVYKNIEHYEKKF